jgi:hypothetical protein
MGRAIRQYPIRQGRLIGWILAIITVIALAGAGLALIFSIVLIYSRYYRFGPALALKDLPLPGLGVLCLITIGIIAAIKTNSIWNKLIILHANGLTILDRRGPQFWRWVEITILQADIKREYVLFIYAGTRHRYTLYKAGGEILVLGDEYTDIESLGQTLRSQIYPRLLEESWQTYRAGKRVSFGPISLNQTAGFRLENQVFLWQSVLSASILNGRLVVKVNDGGRIKNLKIRGEKIPNPDVLIAMLSELIPPNP